MRRRKEIEWVEVRHIVFTLRRMNRWFWQLTDSNQRIVAEGRRRECQDTLDAIRRGAHAAYR